MHVSCLSGALITIAWTIPIHVIKPADRFYVPGDPHLSFPMRHVWLNDAQKFMLIFLLPAVVSALLQIKHRSWIDWHHLLLTLAEGFALETSFKKWTNLVGRHRPDWFARLASGDADLIEDGTASYPSGHAAETFMAFTILTLYLMAKWKLFITPQPGHFARAVLCLTPIGIATYITMSRITGYRHHISDTNAGMAVGLCSGALAYLLNYPSLISQRCDQPLVRSSQPPASWHPYDATADTRGYAPAASDNDETGLGLGLVYNVVEVKPDE
eukprot:jgi/Chrzof1/4358/Cz14g10070.t1